MPGSASTPTIFVVDDDEGLLVLIESALRAEKWGVATATHLYRIAQEAVNNALKHGRARRIDISLEERADELESRSSNSRTRQA